MEIYISLVVYVNNTIKIKKINAMYVRALYLNLLYVKNVMKKEILDK